LPRFIAIDIVSSSLDESADLLLPRRERKGIKLEAKFSALLPPYTPNYTLARMLHSLPVVAKKLLIRSRRRDISVAPAVSKHGSNPGYYRKWHRCRRRRHRRCRACYHCFFRRTTPSWFLCRISVTPVCFERQSLVQNKNSAKIIVNILFLF